MDSFIEKKQAAIKRLQSNMLIKYSLSVFLLLSLPIWISSMSTQPAPETWLSTETVCEEISVNSEAKTPYAIIKGADGGNYLVDPQLMSPEEATENLQVGDECAFVYAPLGKSENKVVKAIEKDGETLLDEEESAATWKSDRQKSWTIIVATLIAAAVSALLIDRVWCKADREEVKRLKAEIEKREERKSRRGNK